MRTLVRTVALAALLSPVLCADGLLQLSPANPHYFRFHGKTMVLVTSGEHYGAVLNRAFDYKRYLDELKTRHLNLTRTWAGAYREVVGNFGIGNNTLAPKPEDFIAPWNRSSTPGAADGNKFDLESWNPAFFARLKDFVREAATRRIVVEVNLFCPFYEESMWQVAPFNAGNNINAVGNVARNAVFALKEERLTSVQLALVRKIVSELREFGNIYYEVCNEPYFGGVTPEWQRLIVKTIHDAEAAGPRHLISMNIANGSVRVENPDPLVSILNFHYSRPPQSVGMNYDLARVVGCNETGFDGKSDAVYRIQGWDFLMAGGALYNNLDYSFAVGHEDGRFAYSGTTPGGGSLQLRTQLGVLRDYFESLDLDRMRPDTQVLARAATVPGTSIRALSDGRRRYAAYVHHGQPGKQPGPKYVVDSEPHEQSLTLTLPAGGYQVTWLEPKSGRTLKRSVVKVTGAEAVAASPRYTEDLVLDIRRK